jgi:hypothetical protein
MFCSDLREQEKCISIYICTVFFWVGADLMGLVSLSSRPIYKRKKKKNLNNYTPFYALEYVSPFFSSLLIEV